MHLIDFSMKCFRSQFQLSSQDNWCQLLPFQKLCYQITYARLWRLLTISWPPVSNLYKRFERLGEVLDYKIFFFFPLLLILQGPLPRASQGTLVVQNSPAKAGDTRKEGSIPGWGGSEWVKSLSRVWLCNPMDCRGLACSFIHGIFQARVLEWVAISFSTGWGRSPQIQKTEAIL